jgi:hypothetical protein
MMQLSVDPWDPAYGVSAEIADLDSSSATVNLDVELPASEWQPITAAGADPAAVALFVDGVRRIDAHVWISGDHGITDSGICASYAAGVVRCDGTASACAVEVGRGLFSASASAVDLPTSAGTYSARMAAFSAPESLSLALQERMGALEVDAAEQALGLCDSQLIVIDGPLRGRNHLPNAVGVIKTHHVAYLPPEQHRLVGALEAGQRTPVFTLGTSWSRHSWYLRLPGGTASPWTGVVRCEASADLASAALISLANVATATLPCFASQAYKDPRAPQNLYPIGALERELRHRLGDPQLVYRRLKVAAGVVT